MSYRHWGVRKTEHARRIFKRLVELSDSSPAQLLLPLRVREEVTLIGTLEVRVVRGRAEVWGAVLRPSAQFSKIVAPPWSALPRVRAVRPSKDDEDMPAGHDEVAALLKRYSWPIVLCFRGQPGETAAALQTQLEDVSGRQIRLVSDRAWPTLVGKFWETSRTTGSEEPPVLLVMGNKGVGKSACCEYFTNTLLSHTSEVCFLDTDLGQPELGPPGLVSLHRLRQPILRAAHASQGLHELVAAFFAGGVTPSVEPVLYVKSVRAAFDAFLGLKTPGEPLPPLVVNTHGWADGFGLKLVRSILSIVRAQLVVRIGSEVDCPQEVRKSDSEDALPRPKRKRMRLARLFGSLAGALEEAAGTQDVDPPTSSVMVDVTSKAPQGRQRLRKDARLLALELRWLRFACYFRPDLDPCARPSAMPMREFFGQLPRGRLSLAHVTFGLVHGDLHADEVEVAFTGALAALCSLVGAGSAMGCAALPGGDEADGGEAAAARRATAMAAETGSLPRLLCPPLAADPQLPAPKCIAVAFVHSFDVRQGEVTFFSPASAAELESVDLILRGDISWSPQSLGGLNVDVKSEHADLEALSPLTPYCPAWMLESISAGASCAHRFRTKPPKLLQRGQ